MLAGLLAGILASAAHAACKEPSAPPSHFPDGSKANRATMLKAKKKVDAYITQGQAFLDCMDAGQEKAMAWIQAHPKMDKKEKAAKMKLISKGVDERNRVLDQMKATAKAFNDEIHKYEAQ